MESPSETAADTDCLQPSGDENETFKYNSIHLFYIHFKMDLICIKVLIFVSICLKSINLNKKEKGRRE